MLLKIKNLRLKTILGIHDWEQTVNREIIINIKIEFDSKAVLASGKIEDTIDYDLITQAIKDLIAKKKFDLIENLAQEILDLILQDKRIQKCKLEIDKVGAVENLESASITIKGNN